ncbi:MAG: tripartite tricarboxylate transporter substrate binding protein [Alphaproteobacteria bacterium]|nr:tripartite tricarboxylate transporter substrate binding protein [Alphaproteobacteria bacterium]
MPTRDALTLLLIAATTIATTLFASPPAAAAWQPTKPITFIVMAGQGGGADKAVRFLVKTMTDRSLVNVPFEVVNIPGNSGGDALAELQRRRGDDHAILFTLNSFYTTPLKKPELKIDISSFTPIARLAQDVFLLWVNSERKDINTIEDFVKAARAKGRDWVMSGTGTGAEDNLLTEFFNSMYGLNITYRALKGGGAVAKELAEKQCDSTVNNPSEQAKFYAEGLTKPIVAITPERLQQYIRIPTLNETGMSFHYYMQRSVVGAPAMSGSAKDFYQELFKNLFNSAEWQAYRKKNSLDGELLTGDALKAYWVKEREKHKRWKMTIDVLQAMNPPPAAN